MDGKRWMFEDMKLALATNLATLMTLSADLKTQQALAKRSKVAQRTISNYLRPEAYSGAPQLDKIAKLGKAFGLEPWQMIHPTMGDGVIKATELALYRRLQDAIKAIPGNK